MNINDINIEATNDVEPAKDRVTEDKLTEALSSVGRAPVVDIDLIAEIKLDPRFNYRGVTMQKAICILLTDYYENVEEPEQRITINEMAFLIDLWFDKPNYGIKRAKTDVRKFMKGSFPCQVHDPDGEQQASDVEDVA